MIPFISWSLWVILIPVQSKCAEDELTDISTNVVVDEESTSWMRVGVRTDVDYEIVDDDELFALFDFFVEFFFSVDFSHFFGDPVVFVVLLELENYFEKEPD